MYNSIKDWINVPIMIRPFERRSGSGDKIFKDAIDILAYPVSEVKYVRNALGADVLSSHQFYIDGSVTIGPLDEVSVNGEWLPISAIEEYYREGRPDIKVVHV